jgi:Tfp pilus assembly protein PilF
LERARARVDPSGTLQVGDQVQVPAPVYLSALEQQVVASIASDDLAAARSLAELAVAVAESADIPAERRRAAFAQLGAVEYRLQAFAEAERHYRSAQTTLDMAPAPERARILNELGAVLIAVGDYAEAAEVLRVAQSAAAGTGAIAAQVANNLAALAALRGDPAQAASLYTTALGLIDASQTSSQADRSVVEKNLAALREQR